MYPWEARKKQLWAVARSTRKARRKLSRVNPPIVVIDTNLFAHAIRHEPERVNFGKSMWGEIEIDQFLDDVGPYRPNPNLSRKHLQNAEYLMGISCLARSGHIKLATCAMVRAEAFSQPLSRYIGDHYLSRSVLSGVEITNLDKSSMASRLPLTGIETANATELFRAYLRAFKDPLFKAIEAGLGGEQRNQDAFILWTAEMEGAHYVLTMDNDFNGLVAENLRKKQPPFTQLKTKVMFPIAFAKHWNIEPVPFNW